MTDDRQGQVVTFYSYKGGTGRTMALANVAWILAANGKRVLTVDWDLDSPGLARFFHPFLNDDALASTPGVTDLIHGFQHAVTRDGNRGRDWVRRLASVGAYSLSLQWPHFPRGATLDFVGAGMKLNDYVGEIAWDNFYGRLGGRQLFEALRADMRRRYDYTLIDSRTGESDISFICTVEMPDVVVNCFTLSEQGIAGGAKMAELIRSHQPTARGAIRILPVQTRIDMLSEKDRRERGFARAKERFAGLPVGLTGEQRERYWSEMQVPYQAFYNYEEILATFGDDPQQPNLLAAYERLAGYLTDGEVTSLPPLKRSLREETKQRFLRSAADPAPTIVLRYEPTDQVWADWVGYVLGTAGVAVHDAAHSRVDRDGTGRSLSIVSRAGTGRPAPAAPIVDETPGSLTLVVVSDLPVLARASGPASASIAGLSAAESAERVLALVGRPGLSVSVEGPGVPRFPGAPSPVFSVPQQNPNFTGREAALSEIRAAMADSMVALHGTSGVGKTQLAMAYAHRYRAAYDVVWWIEADRTDRIGPSLLALAQAAELPVPSGGERPYRSVLQALSGGRPYGRWLLVFDSADEPEAVREYLPESGGHVLITSQDRAWSDVAHTIEVGQFTREESIEQLRRRHPSVTDADAHAIANAVDDFPILVAIAGAHLEESGIGMPQYLHELEGSAGVELRKRVWGLALDQLRRKSPAAHRLLQIFSVFAPGGTAADLAYSQAFVPDLTPLNPAATELMVRAGLAQHLNRLALIKVDQRAGRSRGAPLTRVPSGSQIVMHKLLHAAVQDTMDEAELARTQGLVHRALADARPAGVVDNPVEWAHFSRLWPHLDATNAVACPEADVRDLLIDRVRFLWRTGDFRRGLEVGGQVEKAWSTMLEGMAPQAGATLRRQILRLRFNMGNILRELGEFQASLDLNTETLRQQEEVLTANHPDALLTRGGIGGDLRGLGRYQEALEWDEQTYPRWLGLVPVSDRPALAAWNNLAASHMLMGHFDEALRIDTEVWRLRHAEDPNDPLTLHSQGKIGRLLRELGRYEESIDVLSRVRESHLETLGPDDRGTLGAVANLAVSLRTVGRAAEAQALATLAYERLSEIHGERFPDTQASRLSRSLTLLALGEVDRAEREMVEVRDRCLSTLGAEHPTTFVCTNNLGMIHRALGGQDRALRLSREAAEGLGARLGSTHPHALAARSNLAICLAETGEATAAIELLDQILGGSRDVLGAEHPDTIRCEANLALVRAQLGRDGAEADIEVARRRLAERIKATHPAVEALDSGRHLHRVLDPNPY